MTVTATPKQIHYLPRASYSRISVYKSCPRQYKLKYKDLIPEPDRPIMLDRAGKPKASASERGSWIHDSMDNYINNRSPFDISMLNGEELLPSADKTPIPLLPELLNIKMEVEELKRLKTERPDTTFTEQKWYYDMDWDEINSIHLDGPDKGKPIHLSKIDYAIIAIIDCMVIDDYTDPDFITARIIDLKSGKSYNNASKHAAQLNLYAAAAAHKFPEVKEFNLELLYCDEGKHVIRQVTREQALIYGNYWEVQILSMHKDQYYDPQATAANCRFCPYGALSTPHKINGNKWVNRSNDCDSFIEHPNDTKWRLEQEAKIP